MAFFEKLGSAPADPILGITAAFIADTRKNKTNLGVGSYKTIDLKPFVLPAVKQAEKLLLDQDLNKEYLGIEGDKKYLTLVKELVFGYDVDPSKIVAFQSVGGTGALRVGGDFLKRHGKTEIFIPDPTWDNHRRIFTHSGFEVHTYPYYDKKSKSLDFPAMISEIRKMPVGTVLLLQGCCHNPTGFDPSKEEWRDIIKAVQERALLPFIDFAYQGFGSGIQEDAWAVREFVNAGIECVVASSYSKNFGLYAERTGALFFHCKSHEGAKNVESQVKVVIRGLYSNPPCHGARIVAAILGESSLKKQWEEEADAMRNRILEMRRALVSTLADLGKKEYSFMERQKGMFSYTGLNPDSVERLIQEYGIYLPKDGRVNIAGINHENLEYIASAIADVS
jgi:aspartate/tyrosine/aromatic aminotransferase